MYSYLKSQVQQQTLASGHITFKREMMYLLYKCARPETVQFEDVRHKKPDIFILFDVLQPNTAKQWNVVPT